LPGGFFIDVTRFCSIGSTPSISSSRATAALSGTTALLRLVLGFDAVGEPSAPGIERAIRASGYLDEGQAFGLKTLAGAAVGASQNVPVKIFIENEHVAGNLDATRAVFSFVGHLAVSEMDTARYYSHIVWNVPNKQKIKFSSTFTYTSAGLFT
jgi:hypothetical protein